MSIDARTAKADAKAAKAKAKALRPWYKKKRWVFSGAFVAILAVSAAAGAGKDDAKASSDLTSSSPDTSAVTPNSKVLSHFTNKDHPAVDDVRLNGCELSDGLGTAHLAITNHSSGESNYMVTVEFANAQGTQVGTASGFVDNVSGGQKAVSDALGTFSGAPDGVTCQIKSVDRLAA
jgi:hypothetical protein